MSRVVDERSTEIKSRLILSLGSDARSSYGGEISQTKNAQRLLTFAYQEGGEKMQVPLMMLLFQVGRRFPISPREKLS